MEGKKVSESRVIIAQVMNPENANPAGNVHGGDIMKLIDTAGGVAATRHARAHVVTASIDRTGFSSSRLYRRFLNSEGVCQLCRENIHGSRCPGGSGKCDYR